MNATIDRSAWKEALERYQREEAAYAGVAREYEFACADYDGKRTAPEALARYDAAEKKHNKAADRRWKARTALLDTPAPDQAAMIAKLELLAEIMLESDEQDAKHVALIRDDAKRLLGRE
jgi:hypothetical protein